MKKHFLLILVTIAAAWSAAAADNLIQNGDFDSGIERWAQPSWLKNLLPGTWDESLNQGPGSGSFKIAGEGNRVARFWQIVKLPAGEKKMRLSAWIRTENFENAWTAVVWIQYNENGKSKSVSLVTPWNKSSIDWTEFVKEFTIPADVTSAQVYFGTQAPAPNSKGNGGTVWFDNLSLALTE